MSYSVSYLAGNLIVNEPGVTKLHKLTHEVIYDDGVCYGGTKSFNIRVIASDVGFVIAVAHQNGEKVKQWEVISEPTPNKEAAMYLAKKMIAQYVQMTRK